MGLGFLGLGLPFSRQPRARKGKGGSPCPLQPGQEAHACGEVKLWDAKGDLVAAFRVLGKLIPQVPPLEENWGVGRGDARLLSQAEAGGSRAVRGQPGTVSKQTK